MDQPPHWRTSALAVATALLFCAASPQAHALALGRVTVQSALGEPLRADIDIPDINADEVASLRATVASPEAFRAAGLEYSPAIANLLITLQRRNDGRYFLRLTSDRPVNDPFIDLILEANWASGRIVRDYTMLFDPPNLRQPGTQQPLAAQVSPVMPPSPGANPSVAPRVAPPPAATAPAPARVRPPVAATTTPKPAPAALPRASGDTRQVTVRPGDTASKIAANTKPSSISLDQMLVALLRANPEAFIGGNINRLKAGAVLDVPTSEQAGTMTAGEANQTIVAQSRDFNEFRRKLAEGVPASKADAANRQASGKVQAKVEDKKPAATAPDKLTLSKGSVQAKSGEDKIVKERAAQEAAARVAELNKNIADLNKLGTAAPGTAGTKAAEPAASAPKPVLAVPAPPAVATAAAPAAIAGVPAAAPAASAPTASPTAAVPTTAASAASAAAPAASSEASAAGVAVAAASAPAASAPAAAPKPAAPAVKPAAPPPPEESGLLSGLLENPIIPAFGIGLVALLAGFGVYRARQRKKSTQVDSSFLESRLQPDSFFGASGGQRIDTNEGGATGSSMVYSPSQLDAAGDVDPVAEADVYLAYGRDLQAEEILKEALRTSPSRVAIHGKLLEIYAKRRDAKAFEFVATEAYNLTHGEGPDWEHICELGQELDPSNPMYRPGGQPGAASSTAAATGVAGNFAMATATHVLPVDLQQASPAVDLDLDLDFSLGDDEPAPEPPAPELRTLAMPASEPTVSFDVSASAPTSPMSLDMDFGSATVALDSPPALDLPPSSALEPVRLDAPDLTLSENSLSFDIEPPSVAPVPAPPAPVAAPVAAAPFDSGMIEFDLGSLSLDLGLPAPAVEAGTGGVDTSGAPLSTSGAPLSTAGFDVDSGADPLATKLALAEEFDAIGDPDGARSLAEEVVAEATGELKSKAQRFLAQIG